MAADQEKLTARRALRHACPVACALALLVATALTGAQVQKAPRRIVSLVPALTEIVFAIGAGPQVVAVSSFDEHPPEVTKLPRVGALLDPDTEKILAMRPDLVLVYGTQDDLKRSLQRAGIGVFDYRHAGLAGITRAFLDLGAATGHRAEAETRVRELDTRLDAIRARVRGRPKPRTLLVMSRELQTLRNLNASGGVGFLHEVLELAGGTNVFGAVQRQAVQASNEMLLAQAPDVIVELHYGAQARPADAERDRAAWNVLSAIPAVRNRRVHLLYGDHLVVPGPRIGQAAEEIAKAIHPEAFGR